MTRSNGRRQKGVSSYPPLSATTLAKKKRQLTSICLVVNGSTAKLDIDKVYFELLVCLYTDEDGRTSSADDDFIWEVNGLEDKCESSLLLHTM
jgi:hypothetical protein